MGGWASSSQNEGFGGKRVDCQLGGRGDGNRAARDVDFEDHKVHTG